MNNRSITPTAVRAPCIKVCEMDATIELCKGCFRTQSERDWWVAYSDEQRREVLQRCAQRRDALQEGKRELAPSMGVVESPRKARMPSLASPCKNP